MPPQSLQHGIRGNCGRDCMDTMPVTMRYGEAFCECGHRARYHKFGQGECQSCRLKCPQFRDVALRIEDELAKSVILNNIEKSIKAASNRVYYQQHKPELLAWQKDYRDTHKEERARLWAEYYASNKARLLDNAAAYRKTHKAQIAAYQGLHKAEHAQASQRYRDTHKEKISDINREYYKAHRAEILAKKRRPEEKERLRA